MADELKELLKPTGLIAIWGAILGTVTLIWNIWRDFNQKADLQVTVDVVMIGAPGQGIVASGLLRYLMVNKGHLPVTIVNVGGRVKQHPTNAVNFTLMKHHELSDRLPKTLNHSETASVLFADLAMLNNNLDTLWVADSTGKQWRATKKSLEALRKSKRWGEAHPQVG